MPPPALNRQCGGCYVTDGSWASSFAGKFLSKVVDFVCFNRKIVVEIDGSQHFSSPRDERRDAVLAAEGFRILRYWNNDVLQRPTSVLDDLFAHLSDEKG